MARCRSITDIGVRDAPARCPPTPPDGNLRDAADEGAGVWDQVTAAGPSGQASSTMAQGPAGQHLRGWQVRLETGPRKPATGQGLTVVGGGLSL